MERIFKAAVCSKSKELNLRQMHGFDDVCDTNLTSHRALDLVTYETRLLQTVHQIQIALRIIFLHI